MTLTFVFVSFFGLTICQAQSPTKSWAIGTWKGYWSWGEIMWTLIVSGPDGNEAGKFRGTYMWATEKQKSNTFPIPINIQDDILTFRTVSGDELVLKRISDYRMDGKFITKGKEPAVRFWKVEEEKAKVSSFLGNWEGAWANKLECNLEVLHADDTAITGIYKCKDLPEQKIKGGTSYINGELTFERKYAIWHSNLKWKFTYLFAQDNKKIIAELIDDSGWAINNATFTKKQKPAEIPIPEPAPKKEPGKVKIENGVITFAEPNTPTVKLEEVKTNFPSNSPKEILAIQGSIYGGEWRKDDNQWRGQILYLIPLSYDEATKEIRLLYVTNDEAIANSKPRKFIIGGIYNGSEGNAMKPITDKSDKPWARFFNIITAKQGDYNLRLFFSSESGADFFPVAKLPPAASK
jgi:hypothetical protein